MELWNEIFDISKDREFGFFSKDNLIKFYIPEQLINENKQENFLYLKKYSAILRKYSKTHISRESYHNYLQHNLDDFNLEVISSYLSLIDDYFKYGTFYLFEKFYKKGHKKINWNKTLKENNIIITRESEIIYNSFYTKNIQNNNYNQFYQLYLEALRRSKLYLLGWNHDENLYYPKNPQEQKYHLNKYSEEHFKDREIFISNHLKNIYLNDKWSNINESKFDFKYHLKFEHIWEHMISQITKNNHIPINIEKGIYLKNNITGISLLHDHFIKYNNNYYLFDSKFYKTYDNQIYPDTSEISKQFMYKYLISQQEKIPLDIITNCFIFPKNNKDNRQPELFDIHYNKQFPELSIFCIALDIQTVIDLYLNDSSYEQLNQLFYLIKKDNQHFIKGYEQKNHDTKEFNKNHKFCFGYKSKKGILQANLYLDIDSEKFHVLKGSTGYLAKDKEILLVQNTLINNNIISHKDKNMIIFLKDHIFDNKEEGFKVINGQSNNLNWEQNKNRIRKSKI